MPATAQRSAAFEPPDETPSLSRRRANLSGIASTVESLVRDQRVLAALDHGPQTAREIQTRLFHEVLESWSEERGYDFEWFSQDEPVGARIVAVSSATERGVPHLDLQKVYSRLVKFEKQGYVRRLQVPGHRSILWMLS